MENLNFPATFATSACWKNENKNELCDGKLGRERKIENAKERKRVRKREEKRERERGRE
jgi:hypothetical protein